MPKKILLDIDEDLDSLKKRYRSSSTQLIRDRLKMLYYIGAKKYEYRSDIAKKLGRRPTTIGEWITFYREKGISALLAVKSGGNNKTIITQQAKDFIADKVLDKNTTITSYVELRALLVQELNEQVNYATLYAHCRRKHKTRLKVSRKSHHKKDPKAEEVFKKP